MSVISSSTSEFATTELPATKSEAVRVLETFVSVIQEVQVRVSPPAKVEAPATDNPPDRDNPVP